MKEFREKLEKKLRLYTLFACSSMLIFFGCQYFLEGAGDFAEGLITGFFTGLMIVAIANLADMYSTLKNEEKLKKKYIAVNDERNIAIDKETASTATTVFSMVIALSAIVTGFINTTVCITLAAVLFVWSIIIISVKGHYLKKM